jgi:hypothetical protein
MRVASRRALSYCVHPLASWTRRRIVLMSQSSSRLHYSLSLTSRSSTAFWTLVRMAAQRAQDPLRNVL